MTPLLLTVAASGLQGLEVIGISPQEALAAVRSEMAIAAKLIAVAGIREE